jgi:hypothetical protein
MFKHPFNSRLVDLFYLYSGVLKHKNKILKIRKESMIANKYFYIIELITDQGAIYTRYLETIV